MTDECAHEYVSHQDGHQKCRGQVQEPGPSYSLANRAEKRFGPKSFQCGKAGHLSR